MPVSTLSFRAPLFVSSLLLLAACSQETSAPAGAEGAGAAATPELTGAVRLDGSSTVFPISEAIAEEFLAASPGVRVTVGASGTGGGFSKFMAGETDINNASRPVKAEEIELGNAKGIEYLELAVAYDGLSVVVNPANTFVDFLTIAELKAIWEPASTVDSWNDVRPEWPDQPLRLYGAGTDSGTFDYFTEVVTGKTGAARPDYTASEDDNVVVNCVAKDPQALGYLGYGWFRSNSEKLKALAVVNPKGKAVEPSVQSVLQGKYQPLSRVLFVYVSDQALRESPDVRNFTTFLVRNSPSLVAKANYIPLSESTIRLVETKLYRRVLGTSFGGELPVGLTIYDALQRSFDQHKRPEFR